VYWKKLTRDDVRDDVLNMPAHVRGFRFTLLPVLALLLSALLIVMSRVCCYVCCLIIPSRSLQGEPYPTCSGVVHGRDLTPHV